MPLLRKLNPRVTAAALAFSAIAIGAWAQRGRFPQARDDSAEAVAPRKDAEFHFIRMQYTDLPQFHRRFGYSSRDGMGDGWWIVDWPAADNHFTRGIERLTRIDTGDPRHVRITDPDAFDYPWIYATQAGWWGLSDAETARMREYLLRGGFLVTDDFWGDECWEIFRQTMERVLPGHAITDIDEVRHGDARPLRHRGKRPHLYPRLAPLTP